jgi:glycosyltransferase involved in cell wall biosynthesis
MAKPGKIVAILPAYNVAKSLPAFVAGLPKGVFSKIILVDDGSKDNTYEIAKKLNGIEVHKNLHNLGYGGNLKTLLSLAFDSGADVAIEIHPDGEYLTDGIVPGLQKVREGADMVFGNRFGAEKSLVESGMYAWKYPVTKFLSWFCNMVLGAHIPDLHQGFRIYTKNFADKVNFRAGSNDYIFSFEIIAAAAFKKLKIESVPVSTSYSGKKRGASLKSSVFYTLGTFRVLFQLVLLQLGIKNPIFSTPGRRAVCPICSLSHLVEDQGKVAGYNLFFCKSCKLGFIYPMPINLSKYYPPVYYRYKGLLGWLRKVLFDFFERRRKDWVQNVLSKGAVLDVGSGEGGFGESLDKKYKVTSLEMPFSGVENKDVIKSDFLKYRPNRSFDAVCFWESLEHTPNPRAYLEKSFSLLRNGGYVFIEYPRYRGFESRLFGKNWFHLDIPRHTFHLTDAGLSDLLRRSGFKFISRSRVYAPEYTFAGFAISLLSTFGVKNFNFRDLSKFVLIIPGTIVGAVVESLFYLLGESPIGYIMARK